MSARDIRSQLRSLGANADEADKLARLAKDLKSTPLPNLSAETKRDIRTIPGQRWQLHIYKFAAGGAVAIFVGMLFVAQSALPGSALYGLKRSTEQIRTFIQPSYTETLIDKRGEEIEQLKQNEAAPAQLEQAKKEYEKAIEVYEMRLDTRKQTPDDSQNRRSRDRDNRDVRSWWENRDNDDRRFDIRQRSRDRR